MLREVEKGNRLRDGRIASGLSADQAASAYGKALKGKPITRKAYLKMEEGYLPKDPKRRLILAGLFGIAPALLLSSDLLHSEPEQIQSNARKSKRGKTLNLIEYRAKLLDAEQQGYPSADEALQEAARRINALHNKIFYVSSQEREEMKLILCGYQTWYADIAREQGNYKLALDHFNMAITLAHQEGFTDFEAAAICQRGNLFLDQQKLKLALQDFQQAASFKTPDQLKGYILSLQAVTQMRLAQTDKDKAAALRLMDETEVLATATIDEMLYQHINMCSFSPGRYLRFRANTLMVAPLKKLRSPDQAAEILDQLEQQDLMDGNGEKRVNAYHQMECNLAYARIYRDQGYYPIVVTLLQDTLDLTQQVNSQVHLRSISNIYDDLKASNYGESVEMAMLGVAIMKAQYPQIFH
jgi:tetratricopeptide (TPR) repeat protein